MNDNADLCPNTPSGSNVDTNGCIIVADSDNDGVLDNIDTCPNTPANSQVDTNGCAIIISDEGVQATSENSVQFYANTANWADVHYKLNGGGQQNFRMSSTGQQSTYVLSNLSAGNTLDYSFTYLNNNGQVVVTDWRSFTLGIVAPTDSDNDGVNDNTDLCPNSPSGSNVDTNGCIIVTDSDNDGVNDNADLCPNTISGSNVDANGCIIITDSDNDGVLDNIDACPNTPENIQVDTNGCAIIISDEGVQATSDTSVEFYANTANWADVHYKLNGGGQQNFRMTSTGNTSSYALANLSTGDTLDYSFTYLANNGQVVISDWRSFTLGAVEPIDSDNDGVNDNNDLCPNTPANTNVNSEGCEITSSTDTDNDGVLDSNDLCPNTTANTPVNSQGCEIVPDQVEVSSANNLLIGGAGSTKPGFTLYVWDNDLSSAGSNCNNSCAVSWPPLLVTDNIATGVGSLATIIRDDGSLQATYNGRPLYFFNGDNAAGDTNGHGAGGVWWQVDYGTSNIMPLFSQNTALEQNIVYDRGDALVTRFSDRGRDRHAKEDQFQRYDHYLTHYWTHRTARFEFIDYVAKGGNKIDITFITEWRLDYPHEFRAWYSGMNTVANYHGNYGAAGILEEGPGTWDNDFNKVSNQGEQYKYTMTIDDYRPLNWIASQGRLPLEKGQRMEIEVSQFLLGQPEGRSNYYGTTYLYMVGEGMVPWKTKGDFADTSSEREDSYPIAKSGWLGGNTTLPYQYTNEPDNHFMQMATNLSHANGQPFVLGRRVHHTDFETGQHDEHIDNGVFAELSAKAGTHYVNTSCSSCHVRNGRAAVPEIGESLDKWVFKVAAADGQPDANIGSVLQPNNIGINATQGEGNVSIASWTENNGLRSPNYQFTNGTPALFSARLAPQLVGLGLLEAISETTILAREDVNDANGDGISGKAQLSTDPVTGVTRLGRFGYKAGASSVKHQVAGALNTDMGVMTSVKPIPDCGSAQTTCGNNTGSELADEHLDNLVKYIALLGVRAQRDLDNPDVIQGEAVFNQIGCEGCHRDNMQTSEYAQLAELRNQTIRPFTDLLLHDMGEGLADNLGEGEATGAEWRTAPLWGLGLSACVTTGMHNPIGGDGNEECMTNAGESYLHDGRARTIEEAILWHGGEGDTSRTAYQNLSPSDKSALMSFLNSL